MAGIDKIYCDSKKDFVLFWNWCSKFQDYCKSETGRDILDYFYGTPDDISDKPGYWCREFPITNFTEKIDMWLYTHCPVEFVRRRLEEQYRNLYRKFRRKNSIMLYLDRG
jgi:hypothetical protein